MLHRIVEYAKQQVTDSESGFARRDISWQLELSAEGQFLYLLPIQDKKAKVRVKTSGCPDMPNMRAGGDAKRSQFLVEMMGPAILYSGDKSSDFRANDDTIIRRHKYFMSISRDSGFHLAPLRALTDFLANDAQMTAARQSAFRLGASPIEWVKFVVDGQDPLLSSEVLAWWRAWLAEDQTRNKKSGRTKSQSSVDLLTGVHLEPGPADTHPTVKGVSKGLGGDGGDAQAPLVSMDKGAFESFGLKKAANAAMSTETAQLYADGLSDLLDRAVVVAGTKICYWYSKPIAADSLDPMAALLGLYSDEAQRIGALAAARKSLLAISEGSCPAQLGAEYFSLALSGLKGRIMVRDWIEGNFAELIEHTVSWFDHLSVIGISGTTNTPLPKFETIVTSLLPERPKSQSYGDWVRPIGSARQDLWQCALDKGQPFPLKVLAQLGAVLPRFMTSDAVMKALFPATHLSHSTDDESQGLTIARLYARMGLIKAYFVRKPNGGDPFMQTTVNEEHPDPAYHCGRLLAVLAALQRAALGDVGAGVVQRFYVAASQAPGLTLGRLIANARNHLGNLDGGLPWWYEEQIATIMVRLGDRAPRTLDLEGQGLFALGYYQQLAFLRMGKKAVPTTEATDAIEAIQTEGSPK